MCSNRDKAIYLRQLLDELRQWVAAWRLDKVRPSKAQVARVPLGR